MIHWILQENLIRPQLLEELQKAIEADGAICQKIQVIPFSEELNLALDSTIYPIFYGSTTLMLNAYKNPKFRKGVFYDSTTFTMSNYVAQWKESMLNYDGKLVQLQEIERIESKPKQKWFIRPNADSKTFAGQLKSFEALVAWSRKIMALNLPDFHAESLLWMAIPQAIDKEWRAFVVDKKVVAVSRYMNQGNLDISTIDVPTKLLEFLKTQIETYNLSEVYAIDIAQTNQVFKIIECNCFNGTGFYEHDIAAIVRAINSMIRHKLIKSK